MTFTELEAKVNELGVAIEKINAKLKNLEGVPNINSRLGCRLDLNASLDINVLNNTISELKKIAGI